MAIHATIDWLDDKHDTPWMDRILKINPVYGEAYATAGHFFVINRRYDEGIALYRKALELNPRPLGSARAAGHQPDAPGPGRRSPRSNWSNATTTLSQATQTVNSLRLLDSYKNFVTFKTDNTILRLHKKEAELLRPYFESELKRAIATYEKKYKMKLDRSGAGGGLSRSRRFRRAHHGHAGTGRAGRDVRLRGRDGQPVGPPARQLPLGQHACGTK